MVRWFVGSFVCLFVGSFVRPSVRTFIRPSVRSLVRWFVGSLVRSFGRSVGGSNWQISDDSLTVRGLFLDAASRARRAKIAVSEGCEYSDNGGFGEAELDQRHITL